MDPNKSTSLFQNDSAEFVSGDSRVEISKGLEWKIPVGIVLSIISLWTSVGNAFVIYAIRKTRRLRTVSLIGGSFLFYTHRHFLEIL